MEEELKEYIKNNFLNEDLTYKYINSKNIIKQHNEFYTVLIKSKYWDENLTMGEIFYKIIYNIDKNKCVISECNNSTNFISFNKGYLKCCSHKGNVKQGKITKLERYGDENYNNSKNQ